MLEVKWPATNNQTWVQATFDESDLAAYIGQTVWVRFVTYNNDWGNAAAMYVDDISLEVCED